MRKHYAPLSHGEKRRHTRFFWQALAGLALAGVCATVFMIARGAGQEKRQMLENMQGRADVLIWALEGSARSFGHMRQNPMLNLVEEVARQPGVVYIALVDADGRILIHSDPALAGAMLHDRKTLQSLHVGDSSQSRFVPGDPDLFETYKIFTPSRPRAGGMGHMRRHMMGGHAALWPDPAEGKFIFVGLDASHFTERLHEYVFHLSVIAALVTLAVLGGIVLLFYIQNYRFSKRMLEDTQALAAQVIHSLPAALVVTDPRGVISLSNRSGLEMLGLSGRDEAPLSLHDAPSLNWQALMDELDAGAVILERDMDLFRSGANPLPVSLSAAKIIGSEQVSLGYLFILRDQGEIRKLQKQLRQSERLSAFGNLAAGVAHEIRNPLSSIKGYATYLTEKLKNDKMAYATGTILIQETERLNRVMSDLLSVARPTELHLKPVRVESVLQQAVRLIAPDAEEKGVAVHLRLPPPGSFPEQGIRLDADRLMQALLNLLVNAVQATASGGDIEVTLTGARHRAAGGAPGGEDGFWSISISDTGCGMSAQTVAQLFTPYFTTKASGTGLGLVISQRIVEQHGGEIKVFSRPGKGTTFTIVLPADARQEETA